MLDKLDARFVVDTDGTSVSDKIGISSKDLQERELNVKQPPYNSPTNGIDDDVPFILQACNDLSLNGGGIVFLPAYEFIFKTKLTVPDNVKIRLDEGAVIKRGVNGFILNLGKRTSLLNGTVDANGSNFTGDVVEINQGSNSAGQQGLQKIEDVSFINFDSYAINFTTANMGILAKINRCDFIPINNTATSIKFPDEATTGGNRSITNCYSLCPLVNLDGCDNAIISGNTVGVQFGDTRASILFGVNSKKVILQGNRLAHGTNILNISGNDHIVSNNQIASRVSFDSACTNAKYDASNTDSGFSGAVPFAKNFIYTKGQELAYTPTWTTTGTAPSFGNADVRARYIVEGRTCKVRIHISFGSTTTFGTQIWRFSLPIASTTTSYFTGSSFLGGQSGVAFCRPSDGYVVLYTSGGSAVSATAPITWASGNILSFEFEYNLA